MPPVSDETKPDAKKPLEQLLDLVVYAPLGFLMNIEEVIPQLVEKGRQQVGMARMFGQFAVQQGETEARKVAGQVQEQAATIVGQIGGAANRRRPAPAPAAASGKSAVRPVPSSAPSADGDAAIIDAPGVDELAITDYDSLSTSQVVPRLDGLASADLDAVRRYESAHRGRKTILSKIAQLQG